MCRDTFGANPVTAFTCAASAIFSHGSRGVPAVLNTLNRVPEFPYAQDGTSIPKSSRSARGAAVAVMEGVLSGCGRRCLYDELIRFSCQDRGGSRSTKDACAVAVIKALSALSRFQRRTSAGGPSLV